MLNCFKCVFCFFFYICDPVEKERKRERERVKKNVRSRKCERERAKYIMGELQQDIAELRDANHESPVVVI